MADFVTATRLGGGGGAYTVDIDPEWTVNGNPHGGYLMALLARAALAEDADHPHVLSASAVFLTPPALGPASITVEVLRRGRLASQLRARLDQADRPRVECLFALGRLDTGAGRLWVDGPPVAVAPWADCPVSPVEPKGMGARVAMLEMVEQRIDPAYGLSGQSGSVERAPASPAGGSGEVRGWLRFADDSPFDSVSLLYAADSFPPATFSLGSVGWVPTLELTAYVRGVPEPGPLRIRQRVRVLSDNLVDQVCEVWDSADRVVVQATQLAAVRMAPGPTVNGKVHRPKV